VTEAGPGAWLELSVEADVEAVEAVSEILGRAAPGGTSVEPAFELVDEGLDARLDPSRPAIVRAYVPARDRAAASNAFQSAKVKRSCCSAKAVTSSSRVWPAKSTSL